jgi:hypothetical protein
MSPSGYSRKEGEELNKQRSGFQSEALVSPDTEKYFLVGELVKIRFSQKEMEIPIRPMLRILEEWYRFWLQCLSIMKKIERKKVGGWDGWMWDD